MSQMLCMLSIKKRNKYKKKRKRTAAFIPCVLYICSYILVTFFGFLLASFSLTTCKKTIVHTTPMRLNRIPYGDGGCCRYVFVYLIGTIGRTKRSSRGANILISTWTLTLKLRHVMNLCSLCCARSKSKCIKSYGASTVPYIRETTKYSSLTNNRERQNQR